MAAKARMTIPSALLLTILALLVLTGTTVARGPGRSSPLPSAVTNPAVVSYQGQVEVDGGLYEGTGYFKFAIGDSAFTTIYWSNAEMSGGEPSAAVSIPVSKGIRTVLLGDTTLPNMSALDAGVFNGSGRYFRVWFSSSPGGPFTVLSPDLVIAAVPYALNAETLDGQDSSRFWSLSGNAGTVPGTDFLGTTDDQALDFRVNNARALRLEYGGGVPSVVGGHVDNRVADDTPGATIGGGESNVVTGTHSTIGGGYNITVTSPYATVGGGDSNSATSDHATVGGGYSNAASGGSSTIAGGFNHEASGTWSTIGGGWGNVASGYASVIAGGGNHVASGWGAAIGGGEYNVASGSEATVCGGLYNIASGQYAAVPGGESNVAQGGFSFAAGHRAKANTWGCFVWGDSTDADITCNDDNRWVARASGGVYFYTNGGLTSGVYVPTGGNSWSSVSDRNLKANFSPVDGQDILARLATIPISTWNYKSQEASIRHMGPMAQDFYAAFGLGESERAIATVDADGVALAAIQGLYSLAQEKEAQLAAQQERITALEQKNAELEARMAALEQMAGSGPALPWMLGLILAAGALPFGLAAGLLLRYGRAPAKRQEVAK